ncbi:MAG: zinc-ribbon domain-containing protein [Thermodesulfobacteriota bacterium]|nr:zinc-ribbon domain-containing protein [Thermodesulfobacteriota bacterium]
MIITCEKCGTKFSLDESLLKQEGSKVRCSQCRHIFMSYPPLAQSPRKIIPESDRTAMDKETEEIDDLSNFDLDEKDLNFEFEFETPDEADPDAKDLEFDSEDTEDSLEIEIEDDTESLSIEDKDELDPLEFEIDDESDDTLDIELEDDTDNLDFELEGESENLLDVETHDETDELDFEIDDELQLMKDELSEFETDSAGPDDTSPALQGLKDQMPDKTDQDLESFDLESFDIDAIESSFQKAGQGDPLEENLDEPGKENAEPKQEAESISQPLSFERQAPLEDTQVVADPEKDSDNQEKDEVKVADEVDNEEDDLIPHPDLNKKDRNKKPAKLRKSIMAALFLVLFLFAGYCLCIMRGIEIPYITSLEIPYLTEHLKPVEKTPDIRLVPDKKSVTGKFINNETEGTLFIITGRVTSNSNIPAAHAKVTGTLITKGKNKAMEKTVFCGNTLDDDALKTYEFSRIEQVMSRKKGENNMNTHISQDRPVPFMVVFKDLPDNLENFTITVTDFDQGNLKNKK